MKMKLTRPRTTFHQLTNKITTKLYKNQRRTRQRSWRRKRSQCQSLKNLFISHRCQFQPSLSLFTTSLLCHQFLSRNQRPSLIMPKSPMRRQSILSIKTSMMKLIGRSRMKRIKLGENQLFIKSNSIKALRIFTESRDLPSTRCRPTRHRLLLWIDNLRTTTTLLER